MGQPRIKWGQAERYFLRHGYEIRSSGGDKIIVAPKGANPSAQRNTIRVGHTSCSSPGDELLKVYVSKFNHVFGVTADDILND